MKHLSDERLGEVEQLRRHAPWNTRFEEFDDIESMAAELRRHRAMVKRLEAWAESMEAMGRGSVSCAIATALRCQMKEPRHG